MDDSHFSLQSRPLSSLHLQPLSPGQVKYHPVWSCHIRPALVLSILPTLRMSFSKCKPDQSLYYWKPFNGFLWETILGIKIWGLKQNLATCQFSQHRLKLFPPWTLDSRTVSYHMSHFLCDSQFLYTSFSIQILFLPPFAWSVLAHLSDPPTPNEKSLNTCCHSTSVL